jgi:HAD superfamily hydrolase (TIGR01484 family)
MIKFIKILYCFVNGLLVILGLLINNVIYAHALNCSLRVPIGEGTNRASVATHKHKQVDAPLLNGLQIVGMEKFSKLIGKTFSIYLLDYDNTLGNGEISDDALSELYRINDRREHVVILTGKSMKTVKNISGLEEVMLKKIIPELRVKYRSVFHCLTNTGSDVWRFNSKGMLVYVKENSKRLKLLLMVKIEHNIEDALKVLGETKHLNDETLKLTIQKSKIALEFRSKELIEKYLAHLTDRFKKKFSREIENKELSIEYSSKAIDFTPVSKADAAKKFSEELGINLQEALFCGDSSNDLGMVSLVLKMGGSVIWAGSHEILLQFLEREGLTDSSVTFVNGPDELKEALKFINDFRNLFLRDMLAIRKNVERSL